MNLRLNANAVVENNKGEILAIKLKKGPFSGRLSLPGGGIEPGEMGAATIVREIKEETGINIIQKPKSIGFCEIVNTKIDSHRVVLIFYCKGEGNPLETEEGIPEWKKPEEIEKEGIPFAKETIKMWKSGKSYFNIAE